jgi:hypothetical protein
MSSRSQSITSRLEHVLRATFHRPLIRQRLYLDIAARDFGVGVAINRELSTQTIGMDRLLMRQRSVEILSSRRNLVTLKLSAEGRSWTAARESGILPLSPRAASLLVFLVGTS